MAKNLIKISNPVCDGVNLIHQSPIQNTEKPSKRRKKRRWGEEKRWEVYWIITLLESWYGHMDLMKQDSKERNQRKMNQYSLVPLST